MLPSNHPASPAALLFACALMLLPWYAAPVHAQDACQTANCAPTMEDITAVRLQVLMAKAKADLAEAQGQGTSNANGAPVAPGAPSMLTTPTDPAVVLVTGSAKGLVATLALPGGGTVSRHAGERLGPMTVVSISVSDVVVRDAKGTRSLPWSDGSATGGTPVGGTSRSPALAPPMPSLGMGG